MSYVRKEVIGDAVLYLGDCREILPNIEKADLCLTDPPYGIGRDKGFDGAQAFGGGSGAKISRTRYHGEWDAVRPASFEEMLNRSQQAIVFGGNFFSDILPMGRHWLVWDKLNTMPSFGDCELAWTNIQRTSVKKYTVEYNGLIGREKDRFHATQKPLSLMQLVVSDYSKPADVILDPYFGSCSTGAAALLLDRKFIGIEIDETYFNLSCARLESVVSQPRLFSATKELLASPEQVTLEL